MIVVDTNITAHLFLSGEHVQACEALLIKEGHWVVPWVWRSEFRSVLSKYLKAKKINFTTAEQILAMAENLFSEKEFPVSSSRVLALSLESGCSAYDCEFVALAEHLGVRLVTVDKKIIKSFPKTAISLQEAIHSSHA